MTNGQRYSMCVFFAVILPTVTLVWWPISGEEKWGSLAILLGILLPAIALMARPDPLLDKLEEDQNHPQKGETL